MWLFGDFNGWNKYEFPFERLQYGKWEIKLKPDDKGACRVPHLSKLKLAIKTPSGEVVDRCVCVLKNMTRKLNNVGIISIYLANQSY